MYRYTYTYIYAYKSETAIQKHLTLVLGRQSRKKKKTEKYCLKDIKVEYFFKEILPIKYTYIQLQVHAWL